MTSTQPAGLQPAAPQPWTRSTSFSLPVTSGDASSALASAAVTLSQTYKVHYNAPVPIGPGCCVADVTPNGARIFSNPQGVTGTAASVRTVLAQVMGSNAPPVNRIRVTFYEGASSFGAGAPGDAIQSAAIMSALVGKPVRLQFMRWDEHGWATHGPAMMFDMRAGMDRNGKLVAVEHTDFMIPYSSHQSGSAAGDRKRGLRHFRGEFSRRLAAACTTESRIARRS